jgi:hypothetical protein
MQMYELMINYVMVQLFNVELTMLLVVLILILSRPRFQGHNGTKLYERNKKIGSEQESTINR